MKKKAVIFDLDGTLLNTLGDLANSTNFVLERYNYPKRTTDEVRQFVGNGVAKLIERAIPDGRNNPNFNKCIDTFKTHYSQNMFSNTTPYDGVIELLTNIKNYRLKTAVVSNKFDKAVQELCKRYFGNLIDFCAGENEENGIRKKPYPDTVLKILNELNISANEAIYIGDSEVDIQTAKNAGLDCISVLWGFKDKEFLLKNGAEILISKPDEIFKYL